MKYIFDRKEFKVTIYALYNVKRCGESHELCFKWESSDGKEKIGIKDIV